MKNRVINIVFIGAFISTLFVLSSKEDGNNNVLSTTTILHQRKAAKMNYVLDKNHKQDCFNIKNICTELTEPEKIKNEYLSKLNEIKTEDKKQWFISYKKLTEEYKSVSGILGIKASVYENYDIKSIRIFQKLIGAETSSGDFDSKCNVASVVWNRLQSPEYPNDIISVIYQHNGSPQFSPTFDGRIDTATITEEDALAVEYTYLFGSTAYDCIAFDNVSGNSWNKNNLEYVFTDSINHSFYRKR